MFHKPLIAVILILALATLACGVTINLPTAQVKTGPTVTDELKVPTPANTTDLKLVLSFGAGELKLNPGAGSDLVSGTATYNVPDFKPDIQTNDNEVKIEQGNLKISGIPSFKEQVKNEWDLKLGSTPMDLEINAGAYSGRFELGGLSLQNLDINNGASDVQLQFSEPNPIEMKTFYFTTGASSVTMENLGNANISTMTFRGGAGSYKLDFDGKLQRDLELHVEAGISSVNIIIPEGVPAQVSFEGAISSVNTYGAWEKSENIYRQSGEGPRITIVVKMAAGNLELRNK